MSERFQTEEQQHSHRRNLEGIAAYLTSILIFHLHNGEDALLADAPLEQLAPYFMAGLFGFSAGRALDALNSPHSGSGMLGGLLSSFAHLYTLAPLASLAEGDTGKAVGEAVLYGTMYASGFKGHPRIKNK